MILNSFAICGTGAIRTENQDNVYINGFYRTDTSDNSVFRQSSVSVDRGLYAVGDGMGGESNGALAALMSVQALQDSSFFHQEGEWIRYLSERNTALCDRIISQGGTRMGAAFAGLCINGKRAEITNIGDVRIYLLRGGQLTQRSMDHTAVRQMVELGILSPEASRIHPDRHRLTQHLGIPPSEMIIEPHCECLDVESGDLFLIGSDGLTDMIDDDSIGRILLTRQPIEEQAEMLFSEALKGGGHDNLSILLVKAGGNTHDWQL